MKATARSRVLGGLILLLFLASPALSLRLNPGAYEGGRSRNAHERATRNASAAAMMLGELRTAMSDILYIKTERYLHSGIAYASNLSDKQLLSVSGEQREMDHHQSEVGEEGGDGEEGEGHPDHGHDDDYDNDHNHSHDHGHAGDEAHHDEMCDAGTPTVIPTKEQDFRGFIGRLHREVKPWQDPGKGHQHTDGRELLPWFRVMTVSDPHYVRGYSIGAWWLGPRNAEAALEFIAEGIEKNPAAFQLHYTQGSLLVRKARELERDEAASAAVYRDALSSFRRALDLALEEHRAGRGEGAGEWSTYTEDDAWASARMSVMLEQRYGDPAEAERLARVCIDELGEDATFRRVLEAGGQG